MLFGIIASTTLGRLARLVGGCLERRVQDSVLSVVPAHNKQLERTVIRRRGRAARASLHYAHAARWTVGHAAAQLRRYATQEAMCQS